MSHQIFLIHAILQFSLYSQMLVSASSPKIPAQAVLCYFFLNALGYIYIAWEMISLCVISVSLCDIVSPAHVCTRLHMYCVCAWWGLGGHLQEAWSQRVSARCGAACGESRPLSHSAASWAVVLASNCRQKKQKPTLVIRKFNTRLGLMLRLRWVAWFENTVLRSVNL